MSCFCLVVWSIRQVFGSFRNMSKNTDQASLQYQSPHLHNSRTCQCRPAVDNRRLISGNRKVSYTQGLSRSAERLVSGVCFTACRVSRSLIVSSLTVALPSKFPSPCVFHHLLAGRALGLVNSRSSILQMDDHRRAVIKYSMTNDTKHRFKSPLPRVDLVSIRFCCAGTVVESFITGSCSCVGNPTHRRLR